MNANKPIIDRVAPFRAALDKPSSLAGGRYLKRVRLSGQRAWTRTVHVTVRYGRIAGISWRSVVAVLLMLVLVAVPTAVLSDNGARTLDVTGPLTVWGYVYDLAGQPLEGADVVITVDRTGATSYGVTGSDGRYQGTPEIDAAQYDIGDTIAVVATYNSNSQSATGTVVEDIGVLQIDVHYTYEIPEFGTFLGFIAAFVIVAVVGAVLLARRSFGTR